MAAARVVVLALLIHATTFAAGQLQLYVAPEGGTESLAGASIRLISVPVNDEHRTRLRIRNTGDAAVTLSLLRVAGTGFTLGGTPSLPHIVAPGMNVDFLVHFRPPDQGSFSANLQINSTSYLLLSGASGAITVLYNGKPLITGETIDFGLVERGSQGRAEFTYKNTLNEPIGVRRATVSGAPFSFPSGPPRPYLEPGQSIGFDVLFVPTSAGVFKSTLTIDDRAFWLVGTAVEPAIPRPTIVIDSAAIRSGQQGRVSVRFAERSRGRAQGKLTMELRPAGVIQDNDGAAAFVSGGRRTLEFQIREGQTAAGWEDGYVFQAGTTAGTIEFTVEAGGFTERASVVVAPEPVKIDKSTALRTTSGIDVQFSGFDNTRTLSDVGFTFYSKSGQPLPEMPVKLPVTQEFERWWQDSRLGGIFQLRASFPVSGDASQIGAVEISIVNASGKTDIQRMTF